MFFSNTLRMFPACSVSITALESLGMHVVYGERALRQLYLPDVKLGYIICHIPHCLCKLDSGEWWHGAAASASHLCHFSLCSHLPEMKVICDKFVYNIL